MTATRRLAAILAADIVGYSRLMGAMLTTTLKRNLFAKVDLPPSQGVRLCEPVGALRAAVVYWRCVLSRCGRTMRADHNSLRQRRSRARAIRRSEGGTV